VSNHFVEESSIIIGAGVYIYFREKVRGQMIATDTPANR